MLQKRRFGTRFRETVTTNAVLTQNDGKRILDQKRRYDTRFREAVKTNVVLTQNDCKTHFAPKRRFGTRFRETVITDTVFFRTFSTHTLINFVNIYALHSQ